MINTKDLKVNEILQEMHESLLNKLKRGNSINEDIVRESRSFAVVCHDYDCSPTDCAKRMNTRYDYDMTGDEVVAIFRSRRMANPVERKELLTWAGEVAKHFSGAIAGDREAYERFEKLRKEPALKNGKRHDSQDRMAAVMIYEMYPEIDICDDTDSLHLLGNTLARYFFYDISDAISHVYDFPQYRDTKNKDAKPGKDGVNKASSPEKNAASAAVNAQETLTLAQALRKIEQLENKLERTNTMLQDLQDEFEQQLEESKVKELTDFFAKLNSEKYGCILDELLVVRKGVDELRKSNYELPIEINGLLIMTKKLIQFVRDSHIEPIMKINSIKEVIAADVEYCNYDGTPFEASDEKKTVKVISPGWVYKDKEIQISRPKVKEEN